MAVVSELSRIVSEHHLMAISETEQDIVTQSDRNTHLKVNIIFLNILYIAYFFIVSLRFCLFLYLILFLEFRVIIGKSFSSSCRLFETGSIVYSSL